MTNLDAAISHSRRKTPIAGITTARSEKDDKKFAHRRTRQAAKEALAASNEPVEREHPRSGGWSFAKDGKKWFGDRWANLMRK